MSLVDVIQRREFQTRGAKCPFTRLKKYVRIVWGELSGTPIIAWENNAERISFYVRLWFFAKSYIRLTARKRFIVNKCDHIAGLYR